MGWRFLVGHADGHEAGCCSLFPSAPQASTDVALFYSSCSAPGTPLCLAAAGMLSLSSCQALDEGLALDWPPS